jgi:hypothetical protein
MARCCDEGGGDDEKTHSTRTRQGWRGAQPLYMHGAADFGTEARHGWRGAQPFAVAASTYMVVTIASTDARPDESGEGDDPRLELTEGNECIWFLFLFGNSTSPLFPAVVGCALTSDAAVRTARKTTLQSQNLVYVRFDGHRSESVEHVHTAQRFRYIYNEH